MAKIIYKEDTKRKVQKKSHITKGEKGRKEGRKRTSFHHFD